MPPPDHDALDRFRLKVSELARELFSGEVAWGFVASPHEHFPEGSHRPSHEVERPLPGATVPLYLLIDGAPRGSTFREILGLHLEQAACRIASDLPLPPERSREEIQQQTTIDEAQRSALALRRALGDDACTILVTWAPPSPKDPRGTILVGSHGGGEEENLLALKRAVQLVQSVRPAAAPGPRGPGEPALH